ncbi:MAG: PilZ domain-containing protein [Deltaproteobacteria bacterium]|nr:PilZ domain-containing protein [Deltaproteobacteria bacterium]MBW2661334.1 PilZ domain-containing protein [Deltaproteobacteria bacterium]
MIINNRKHHRIDSLNLISYVCFDEDNNPVMQGMGRTLNVSESGILLDTNVMIDSNYTLSLKIGLEDELMDIKGKVVYSRSGGDGNFKTGIQLFEIEQNTLKLLKKYIKRFMMVS